jgi:type I restriction enzyme R subunit
LQKSLAGEDIDPAIVERFYQTRAIRRVAESFEKDSQRKTLLVMATGAGKTRTVIALCDLLMRANWAKRVLFLADRVALVRQAVNAFKRHLPSSSPVNLVTEKDAQGRACGKTHLQSTASQHRQSDCGRVCELIQVLRPGSLAAAVRHQ